MNFLRNHIVSVIITLLIIISVYYYFDITTNPKTALPHPVQMERPDRHDAYSSISGKVIQYGMNRIGDIDKIILETTRGEVALHFPPHTAKKLLSIAQKGTMVQAGVEQNDSPDGKPMVELLSLEIENTGRSVQVRDIPPPAPSNGVETEITGSSVQLQLDERGNPVGFILSGKLVELKPKMSENLSVLLQRAKSVKVKGIARSTDEGFVNANGFVLVKPTLINIDNINYIVQ